PHHTQPADAEASPGAIGSGRLRSSPARRCGTRALRRALLHATRLSNAAVLRHVERGAAAAGGRLLSSGNYHPAAAPAAARAGAPAGSDEQRAAGTVPVPGDPE